MAKTASDNVLDALGNYVKTNGTWLAVCEGQPTTYEHAHSNKGTATGKVLAHVVLDTGDYALADDTSGRKVTIAEQATITINVSGTADYVAIVDVSNTALLVVTTCTSQALVATNTVTFPAFKLNVQDPS